jgi:heterodisulfide reductase subunit C
MLEAIRTFFGKLRGYRGDRETIIQQTMMWRCTECFLVFPTKEAGDKHKCPEQKLN